MTLAKEGWAAFPANDASRAWAAAAYRVGLNITRDPAARTAHLRHGATWFVGVDALPNDAAGALEGVPLSGPWEGALPCDLPLHRGQLSVIYPGYPQRDPGQSAANHRYRRDRRAAHVDGLLPIGTPPRRFPREFHAYVLGIHLNACDAAPTVVWPGSHHIIGAGLRDAIGTRDPACVDVTEAYHAARRQVFAQCQMRALTGPPGAGFLLHRFTLHGTDIWVGEHSPEGRMIAFFRPEFSDPLQWISVDT